MKPWHADYAITRLRRTCSKLCGVDNAITGPADGSALSPSQWFSWSCGSPHFLHRRPTPLTKAHVGIDRDATVAFARSPLQVLEHRCTQDAR